MLLRKLNEYSERLPNPPPILYSEVPVRYLINLDHRGGFVPPVVDTGDPSSPRTRRGQRRLLPQVQRSSAIRPLLMADKADYTLGYVGDQKGAERARYRHKAYVDLVELCAVETGDPDVHAVLRFLRNDPLGQVRPDRTFDSSGIITFSVEDRITVDNPAVQAFWASVNAAGANGAPTMQCLVCGNHRPVLDRMQAKIRGIPGGQTAGTSLISANSDSFESYGLRASLIAPTCPNCGEGFSRGLNALLSREQNRLISGSAVLVFWTRDESGFNFLDALDDPDPSQVQALLETVRTGRWTGTDDEPFYALSLSASGARAVVRDWLNTTVGLAKQNLALWFQRQHITTWPGDAPRYYGVRALAFGTVAEAPDLPVNTPRILMRTAVTGAPLPREILYQAVRRNRAEQGVNRPRASLIKLALLSQSNDHGEDYLVQLDSGNVEPAYLCGRLLALLERAQQGAIRNLNSTIVDRFYSTVSTAPQPVFARLLKGVRFHLSAISRVDRDGYYAIQTQMDEVMSGLNAFPNTLNPEQQGMFALGYYHQRSHDRDQSLLWNRTGQRRERDARIGTETGDG